MEILKIAGRADTKKRPISIEIGRFDKQIEKGLLVLLGIALLADLAVFLGFHTALVFAILAGGFRLFTAGFSTNDGHAAEQNDGADDCTDGLHVFSFLAVRLRTASLLM